MSKLAGARVALAALALALILLPGEIWGRPEVDHRQEGFDEQLVFVQPRSRALFDPLLVLETGSGKPCPCEPGAPLTIAGQGFAESAAASPDGAYDLNGIRVLVDGEPALLRRVGPARIDLVLPAGAAAPVARVSVLKDGRALAADTVAVGSRQASDPAQVSVDRDSLRLSPRAGGEPAVHLLTSPLSFRARLRATVEETYGEAVPLRVSLWNPRNFSSLDLVFRPDGFIATEFVESRGRVAGRQTMSAYETGVPYEVVLEWRRSGSATITVHGHEGARSVRLSAREAPALLEAYRPSLSVFASAHEGRSSAVLGGYQLELLPERFTTLRIDDPLVPPLALALAALGVVLPLLTFVSRRSLPTAAGAIKRLTARLYRNARSVSVAAPAGLTLAVAGYTAANLLLFRLGGHPFDMSSQVAWAYIAAKYGITDLYYVSQTATLAAVWDGMPYHEAVFPYNVAMSYYFWAVGEAHVLLFGHASPDGLSMQMTVKAFNLAFMLADGALAFAIVRRLKPAARLLPWGAAALLLLNPAFIFDTAVWGETEAVVLFPVLASLLAALKDRPGVAWPMLALAFLSKQTVIVPVLVIAVYYLFRFPLRRNLEGFSGAMVLVSLVTLPFTLHGYPPSIAIDPTLAALWVHGGAGAELAFQVVSLDGFNLWTLVTFLADGATGAGRFQFPDHAPRLAGLSYHQFGVLLVGLALLGLLAAVLLGRRRFVARPEGLLLAVGAASLLEMFLATGALSRYFLFPVVFVSVALSGRAWRLALPAVLMLTFTTFVAEYGSMALVLEDFPAHAPELAPGANAISRAMAGLYLSDWFLTVAALLNGGAVLLVLAAMAGEVSEAMAPAPSGPRYEIAAVPGGRNVTATALRASGLSESELAG